MKKVFLISAFMGALIAQDKAKPSPVIDDKTKVAYWQARAGYLDLSSAFYQSLSAQQKSYIEAMESKKTALDSATKEIINACQAQNMTVDVAALNGNEIKCAPKPEAPKEQPKDQKK